MDFWSCVKYRVVVGSRAYGLETGESDIDVRGFFIAPTRTFWGFQKPPEQLENEPRQECFWEVEKFLNLVLSCNPNILECLYSPIVLDDCPLAVSLRSMPEAFLTKLAYERYHGYAEAQFRKLQNRVDQTGEVNWKHALHLIRLLMSGTALLREGRVKVDVSEHRESLLAIKRGQKTWEEIDRWRQDLTKEIRKAFSDTSLPDEPDRARVEALLIEVRKANL